MKVFDQKRRSTNVGRSPGPALEGRGFFKNLPPRKSPPLRRFLARSRQLPALVKRNVQAGKSAGWASPLQPAGPVRRPALAAHAVVAKEEPRGIVLLLDRQKSRVVLAPELALPILLEIVGLIDVAAGAGRGVFDDFHRRRNPGPC